ncbi:unnamed protein product [Pseudo-nitzschia multistriata]|uniref:Uncharacterized protein n=1 Tax=Pseudo-nitzschia multistriata TaxID=183589 RepID=A0A448YUY0_9STRA|nr:unnamed protein product [Pseudo-nitzschia multistriata]
MSAAPRRPKSRSQQTTPNSHQRDQNHAHRVGGNAVPSSFSISSAPRRKKHRIRSLVVAAVVLVLCAYLLWLGISLVFVLKLSSESRNKNNRVHSGISPISKQRQFTDTSLHKLKQTRADENVKSNAGGKGDDSSPQDAPYKIVHSLTTRFMLGQKGQPVLARARYLLFETFCQPTVRYQTALRAKGYDFSWFVFVDPGIDPAVIEDMRALLTPSTDGEGDPRFPDGNAYLILTDNPSWAADGIGVPGVTSYGAGFQEVARAVRDGTVELLTGDATRLVETLERDVEGGGGNDQTPTMLIETMLDADDGLNNRAIEWIQDLAVGHVRKQQGLETARTTTPSLDSTWWLLCGTDHIEWHNRDIFRLTETQYQKHGLSSGIVGLRHAPHYCASAGFTRVGLTTKAAAGGNNEAEPPLLSFPQVAYSNHALATEEFDLCNDGEGGDPKISLAKCFRRDFEGLNYVLKSRSITSDSMDHMDPRNKDYRDLPWESKEEHPLLALDAPEQMWGIVRDEFSIDQKKARETSVYLRENLASILKENRDSRCAPGFPCREVADVAFKKMTAHIHRLNKFDRAEAAKQNGK